MKRLPPTVPHVSGSPTSRAAADSMRRPASGMRVRVLELIANFGSYGLTCEDVERLLQMRHQTAGPRIKELKDVGLVIDTGRTRPTSSGRQAAVYVASAFARRELML